MSAATAVTVFIGAAIFDGDRLHEDAALVVEDGRIMAIVPAAEAPDGVRVELDGGTLAPGFIDIQVNGGAGILLNDKPDVEGIAAICAAHGRLGTTGLLPTLITDTPQATRATIEAGVAAAGSVWQCGQVAVDACRARHPESSSSSAIAVQAIQGLRSGRA